MIRARHTRIHVRWALGGFEEILTGVDNAACVLTFHWNTGIPLFSRLVEQVMSMQPYASADRVFWIVDNGSSHRGAASIKRMGTAWPNAHLTPLPVHAS